LEYRSAARPVPIAERFLSRSGGTANSCRRKDQQSTLAFGGKAQTGENVLVRQLQEVGQQFGFAVTAGKKLLFASLHRSFPIRTLMF
jgi:hypothetical protein